MLTSQIFITMAQSVYTQHSAHLSCFKQRIVRKLTEPKAETLNINNPFKKLIKIKA